MERVWCVGRVWISGFETTGSLAVLRATWDAGFPAVVQATIRFYIRTPNPQFQILPCLSSLKLKRWFEASATR